MSSAKNAAYAAALFSLFSAPAMPVSAQAWRDAANARIDTHRKSDVTVSVTDRFGQAVEGAGVRVEMQRHHFRFGTAVDASLLNNPSTNGQIYRQKLQENFNEVVFENDLKFPPWIGLWGNGFNWPNTRQALDWLDANDLPARGHYLAWGTWSGTDAWGDSQNTGTLPQRLLNHITDKATTVGDRVYEWDVINHPVGWLNDTYENRIGPDFYGDIVDHARSVVPDGTPLWINEDDVIAGNSRAADYERIIRKLEDDGSPVDGIGFQAHFIEEWGRVSNSTPQQVYDRIDRFADLGRLRVTEFDIDVGGNEALQGELMRDYLTAMFSHEGIEAITMWGFWAGRHWRGQNGALYRQDWSEKPSLTAYRDLVFGEWWTDDEGLSDSLGDYTTRAFDGYYDITVNLGGETLVLEDQLITSDGVLNIQLTTGDLPGDFNTDGIVNAADYAVWREGLSAGTHTPDEYTLWLENFGRVDSPDPVSVPEPTSLVVLGCLAATAAARSRRAG